MLRRRETRFDDALLGKRLLVVDDHRGVAGALAAVLEHCCGAIATVVYDAATARKALDRKSFDAVLSDIAMPGESGLELIRTLRRHANVAVRAIPAVAWSVTNNEQEALTAGFDAFICKPCTPEALQRTLFALFARSRNRLAG